MANRTFRRGQSTFVCRCCGRVTRDVGGEGGVKLCFQCYELAGLENQLSDEGVSADLVHDARIYFDELASKGISTEVMAREFGDLYAATVVAVLEAPAKVELFRELAAFSADQRLARRRAASARRRAARKAVAA